MLKTFLQLPKKFVPHLASGGLDAEMICLRFDGDVPAGNVEFELVREGEVSDEFFVLVGFGPAQLVIEVDDRQDDAEFVAKLEKEA